MENLDFNDLIDHNIIPCLDPTIPTGPAERGANAFLAEYGGLVEEVAIITKKEDGLVLFRSGAAPSDREHENFFTDFSELANDLGIKTHAFAYGFGDSFLGQDNNYSIQRSGGTRFHDYVCPTNDGYWKHLYQITREITRHAITSIILQETHFPRAEFPFSRRAVRQFSEISGVTLDTTYVDLERDPTMLRMYEDYRVDIISRGMREIVEMARMEKPDISVGMMVPIDPETDWINGVRKHFGIDIDQISRITNHLVFHIMPYSPLFPEEGPGSTEWDDLVNSLSISGGLSSFSKDLFLWGLADETDLGWLDQLRDEINPQRIFARLDHPPKYVRKREIHRNLVE